MFGAGVWEKARRRDGGTREATRQRTKHKELLFVKYGCAKAHPKTQDIEWAIYDLKAVNPNAKREEDVRTPVQLLASITQHGHEAEAALRQLSKLL